MHRRSFLRAGSVDAAADLVCVPGGRALPPAGPVRPVRYASNPDQLGELVVRYDHTPASLRMGHQLLATFMLDCFISDKFVHKAPLPAEKQGSQKGQQKEA